jgi:hypothetical protein
LKCVISHITLRYPWIIFGGFGLVLLRHKFIGTRRAIEARQHGHRGKRLTRASMMRRRTVAIEFGT